MITKSAVYGLLALLAGSAITGGTIIYRASAEQKPQLTSPPACVNNTMSQQMRGRQEMDRHFIEMMIPHHQDAVEMADLALQKAKRPEIKKLAAAIKTDQTREIEQMKAWYKQWYGTDVPANSMNSMGMGHGRSQGSMHSGMMGMNMNLESLKNASDFDKEFIRQMIPHHQMAVMMSQMTFNRATHSQIRDLAQAIIKSQTAEIQQMQQWYQAWS
ncbi:MAG: DUF305 domain-containing protein [Aulosira sp. ZfuVER01]|nr:DUF305 domain-containing protein [Aulosira sp. ZfuVER01]MDZ7998174.1 DUF305 domain-containing protein [Aulosira sp. DedVER01a]MDZ8052824.1 DUF305 domain-containing protein [Aulosira sp. ZfuCHP01]